MAFSYIGWVWGRLGDSFSYPDCLDDVRRTLILFYFDEMSTKEIAEALGIPQGTVLWRLNFAKKKIKKEVEKYEDDNNTKLFAMALPFL